MGGGGYHTNATPQGGRGMRGQFEQMEEEDMGWGKRYMLHPSSFGVKVLPLGLQPGEGPW